MLPFSEHALPMPPSPNLPCAPSLCCAFSNKSQKFSAFRFHYYDNESDEHNHVFQVYEIEMDDSPLPSPPLPPKLYLDDCPLIVFDPIGQVYFVTGGVDNYNAYETYEGNRYVKVEACEINTNKGRLLKSKKKKNKRRQMEHDEEQVDTVKLHSNKGGQVLKSCKSKKNKERRHMEHEEEQDETVNLDSNKRQVLKKCTRKKRQMGADEEDDETVMLDLNKEMTLKRCRNKNRQIGNLLHEDEMVEFKLTHIWRRSFFGPPMCDTSQHVYAAFAM